MPTIDLSTIEAGIKALNGIDLAGLKTALASGTVDGYMLAAEDAAKLIVPFLPDAQYVVDVLEGFILIDKLRQMGFWSPAQPEDPAMQRAAGNTGQGTPAMHQAPPVFPGATPNDPYGWDAGNKL